MFHLCQDEVWLNKARGKKDEQQPTTRRIALHGSRSLKRRSSFWMAAEKAGLRSRALSERLATGPGAIYWHVANKSDLLTAACDAIIARTM